RTSFLWPRRNMVGIMQLSEPQQAQFQSPSPIMHYNSSKQPMVAGDATGRDRRTGHRGTAESWCLESTAPVEQTCIGITSGERQRATAGVTQSRRLDSILHSWRSGVSGNQ